ncbi:L-aspartate dehydrogenase [Tepiditoga spiralis]|uniref:L-aspartate dehydrogenase n=1 Tax=Tepiditoga spiralis TaxID=2108365 RepID=A0A7G1G7K5_9BACT|nr:aspartate dehydrogenase [Tepiditoga spiralis]BBE31164.1 L-aspartate dehydrogenase [Tepiditoga spiralis]
MKLFFIGGGNSTEIILEKLGSLVSKAYIFDTNNERMLELSNKFNNIESSDINKLKNLDVNYVVECASVEAVKSYAFDVLNLKKDFIILSTGAFADDEFRNKIMEKLENSENNIYIPSGAVGAVDIINATGEMINKITLTTRKPPKSLGVETDTEQIIFEGTSKEAIKKFPKNINVAVTLSVASGDFDKVFVRIIADPKVNRNIHTVEIDSEAGNYKLILENYPSKNPKTSYLAPLSVAGLLKKLTKKLKVGV